jgi:hypothetical protein
MRTLARLARIDQNLLHPIRHRTAEARPTCAYCELAMRYGSRGALEIDKLRARYGEVGGRALATANFVGHIKKDPSPPI